MGPTQSIHRQSCTVAVERNQYGAMTLRTDEGRTYQVVGAATPVVADRLDDLSVDSRATVTLIRAPGRGSGWRVTAVDSVPEVAPGPTSTSNQHPSQ